MSEKKQSKISEIRATAFDAVVIMRHIGNPEVLESLSNVKETISNIKEVIKELQTPEMVKNIDNFRIISENINDASTKFQTTVDGLTDTGLIDQTSNLVESAKRKIDSFEFDTDNLISEDIHNTVVSTQEMFGSIKELVKEIKETVVTSKKSETVARVRNTINDAAEIYQNTTPA